MLPDMAAAITASRASRLVVLNLAAQQGETEGFSPEQHLDVLSAHAPNLRVDSVLADRGSVALPQRLASAAARLGATLDLHDVAVPGTARHDPSGCRRRWLRSWNGTQQWPGIRTPVVGGVVAMTDRECPGWR